MVLRQTSCGMAALVAAEVGRTLRASRWVGRAAGWGEPSGRAVEIGRLRTGETGEVGRKERRDGSDGRCIYPMFCGADSAAASPFKSLTTPL